MSLLPVSAEKLNAIVLFTHLSGSVSLLLFHLLPLILLCSCTAFKETLDCAGQFGQWRQNSQRWCEEENEKRDSGKRPEQKSELNIQYSYNDLWGYWHKHLGTRQQRGKTHKKVVLRSIQSGRQTVQEPVRHVNRWLSASQAVIIHNSIPMPSIWMCWEPVFINLADPLC